MTVRDIIAALFGEEERAPLAAYGTLTLQGSLCKLMLRKWQKNAKETHNLRLSRHQRMWTLVNAWKQEANKKRALKRYLKPFFSAWKMYSLNGVVMVPGWTSRHFKSAGFDSKRKAFSQWKAFANDVRRTKKRAFFALKAYRKLIRLSRYALLGWNVYVDEKRKFNFSAPRLEQYNKQVVFMELQRKKKMKIIQQSADEYYSQQQRRRKRAAVYGAPLSKRPRHYPDCTGVTWLIEPSPSWF